MTDLRQILLDVVEQADLTDAVRIGLRLNHRPFQVTLIDDAPPLDPDVKARLEKTWDQWTSTCTSEVGLIPIPLAVPYLETCLTPPILIEK